MEITKKQMRNRLLIFTGGIVCLGACWFLPLLLIPFTPVAAAALGILFLNKSKLFYILAAAVLLLPVLLLGDMAAVLFTFLTVSAAAGILAGLRVKKFLLAAALAVLIAVVGFAVPTLTYLTVYHITDSDPSNGRFVSAYIKSNRDRPDIFMLSHFFYSQKEDDGSTVLSPHEEGYRNVAGDYFSAVTNAWAEEELFYFVLGHAVLVAILGFCAVYYLYRRFGAFPKEPAEDVPAAVITPRPIDPFAVFSSPREDCPVHGTPPPTPLTAAESESMFVQTEKTGIERISLSRKYVWRVFIPVSLLSFLGYVPVLAPAVIAFFNALVVVPCFFAAISLFLYAAFKIPKKGLRIGIIVLIISIMCVCFVFPIGMLFISLFGLADAILRVRKLLDFALS